MVRFQLGPADGTTLSLGRVPLFLRVVVGPNNKIDALDQLEDKPSWDEKIFVYRLIRHDGGCFVDGRKNGKRIGGFSQIALYSLNDLQPDDATARTNGLWRQWVFDTYEKKGVNL